MTTQSPYENSLKLFKLMTSFWLPQALFVACKLKVPDLIADQIVSIDELAQKTKANTDTLYRLLRALSAESIFVEENDRRFRIGELGKLLQSDSISSMSSAVQMYNTEAYKAWGHLFDVVTSGEPEWEKMFGAPYFDYLVSNPDSHTTFNRAMKELGTTIYSDHYIKDAYPIKQNATVVDVGGGTGGLLACLLKDRSDLKGILFDLQSVLVQGKAELAKENLNQQIEFIEGDFFKGAPKSGSVYVLKRILHDWPDEKAVRILKNCAEAMNREAKLLVIEYLVPPPNVWSPAYFIDLHMMTLLGGLERRKEEFSELFDKAGLHVTQVIQTKGLLSIIEGQLK